MNISTLTSSMFNLWTINLNWKKKLKPYVGLYDISTKMNTVPLNIFFIQDNYSGAQMQGGGNRP